MKKNEKLQVLLYQKGGKFWFGTEGCTWTLKLTKIQRSSILPDGKYV